MLAASGVLTVAVKGKYQSTAGGSELFFHCAEFRGYSKPEV